MCIRDRYLECSVCTGWCSNRDYVGRRWAVLTGSRLRLWQRSAVGKVYRRGSQLLIVFHTVIFRIRFFFRFMILSAGRLFQFSCEYCFVRRLEQCRSGDVIVRVLHLLLVITLSCMAVCYPRHLSRPFRKLIRLLLLVLLLLLLLDLYSVISCMALNRPKWRK